jgi:hypothetical protein
VNVDAGRNESHTHTTPAPVATYPSYARGLTGELSSHFAEQALGALPGFKAPLQPGKPKPFKGTPLEAVETTASGTQAGGLEERATLIVLRRDHFVNYTVAVLENAEHPGSELDRAVALRMVETLRDLPPKGAGGQ